MIDRKIISRDELCDLVAAVLEYNKIKATEFAFFTLDGQPLMADFEVRIAYESEPLKVRTVPENETDNILKTSLDQAYGMVEQWRSKRQQQTTTPAKATMSEILNS